MSPRASSVTSSPPSGLSTANGDPAVLAIALDASLALARATTHERAAQEAAQLLRRLAGAHAVAIGLASPEAPHAVSLVAQLGFADAAAAQSSIDTAWDRMTAPTAPVASESTDGIEVVVPLTAGETLLGLVVVRTDHGETAPVGSVGVEQRVAAVARPLALAFERATLIHHADERLRLDAIGDVAAGLAHELRNPLFGISSAAQLLRYRVTEDPVVERNVGRILREVERLNTMVTALLEYGRPSPMQLEQGDPDDVWDDVLAQQRGRLESKALRVRRERAPRAASCRIDRPQLAQVLMNLLDNAIDAAPEGTDLGLTTEWLPAGAWRSRLINGGPSVPPDVRQRAFELFFSTKPAGTGVGLPLARRIVEEHGGAIRLDSDARSGTVVTVTIPGG